MNRALVVAMFLISIQGCSDTNGGPPPCVSNVECGVICAATCAPDSVVSAVCDSGLMTCDCECDSSGSGGSGGSVGAGGAGGSGGVSGTGGTGGVDLSCGASTECDPEFPSNCGTICIEPICGGIDNFDTARCGDDGRCECICLSGACSQ